MTSKGSLTLKNATTYDAAKGLVVQDIYLDKGKISNQGLSSEVFDCSQYVVIPGLINAHTHAPMNFLKGYCHKKEDLIHDIFFPREKNLDAKLVADLSNSFCFESLKRGVTYLSDHYYFSKSVAQTMSKWGLRGRVGETLADLGGAFPTNDTASFLNQTLPEGIEPSVCPHAMDTVSPELISELAEFAKSKNLPLHMHLSQTDREYDYVRKKHQMSPCELAVKSGAAGENSTFVHLVSATKDDFKKIYDEGAYSVICPSSEMIYARLPDLNFLDPERTIIATDCAASSDHANVLSELRFFSLLYRQQTGVILDPNTLFAMVTTNPAKALMSRSGSFKEGNFGDFAFFKKSSLLYPEEQIPAHLIYADLTPDHLMIKGKWIYKNSDLKDDASEFLDAMNTLENRVKEHK